MLYGKKIEPHCAWCERSRPVSEDDVLCPYHGVVSCVYKCRRFRYDPLKRIPPRPVRLRGDDSLESLD